MRRPSRLSRLVPLLALLACGNGDLLAPGAAQGIDGLVLIGPMCPVQTLDDPCPDAPYQAWIEVSNSSGNEVTTVYADEEGRFRVGLRPGTYVVGPERIQLLMRPSRYPIATDQEVVVERGRYTSVLVSFDSGIR